MTLPSTQGVVIGTGGATVTVTSYSDAYTAITPDTLTVPGPVTGASSTDSLTKTGTGTLVLSNAANTYSEKTVIAAGTVVVSGSISGTSSVTVGGGATPTALAVSGSLTTPGAVNLGVNALLSGNGIVSAASVTAASGATVEPTSGNSAGLTINNGPVTLSSASTLQLSLANSNAGTSGAPALADYSKLTLGTGVSADIAGSDIAVTITGAVNNGDLFTVILNNGGSPVSGMFANASTNQVGSTTYAFTSNGQSYDINYAYSGNTTGSDISQAAFQANTGGDNVAVMLVVPEPNSLSMLMGSLGVALGLQRFRRRRR